MTTDHQQGAAGNIRLGGLVTWTTPRAEYGHVMLLVSGNPKPSMSYPVDANCIVDSSVLRRSWDIERVRKGEEAVVTVRLACSRLSRAGAARKLMKAASEDSLGVCEVQRYGMNDIPTTYLSAS